MGRKAGQMRKTLEKFAWEENGAEDPVLVEESRALVRHPGGGRAVSRVALLHDPGCARVSRSRRVPAARPSSLRQHAARDRAREDRDRREEGDPDPRGLRRRRDLRSGAPLPLLPQSCSRRVPVRARPAEGRLRDLGAGVPVGDEEQRRSLPRRRQRDLGRRARRAPGIRRRRRHHLRPPRVSGRPRGEGDQS